LAAALELARVERAGCAARLAALRDRLETGIAAAVAGVRINAAGAPRLPNMSSIGFADASATALLIGLDLLGVAAAAGSACAAGSLEPSHVVAALDLPEPFIRGVIRFSLGQTTSASEIDRLLAILPPLVAQARGVAAVV
jgi:cysteine desulfurase